MADPDYAAIQSAIASQAYQEQYGVSQTPFHTHNSSDSSSIDFTGTTNRTRFIVYRLLAPADAVAVSTLVGGYFSFPFSGGFGVDNSIGGRLTNPLTPTGIIQAFATVDTAGTTGSTIIDVLKSTLSGSSRTSVFTGGTHALTIPSGFQSSLTNTAQPIFTTNTFNVGDRISFDVDSVSSSAPLGLTVYLRVTETSQ